MPNVNVGVGISRLADTTAAVQAAVRDAMEQARLDRAGWAFCFFTGAHLSRAHELRDTIVDGAGCQALCGCSALGVMGRGEEIDEGPAVAVLVGSSPAVETHSLMLPGDGAGVGGLASLPGHGRPARTLIVLPDSYQVDNAKLRDRLELEASFVPVVGAGATDDGTLGISLQLGMEGVRSNSIAAMGLSGDLEVEVGITQTCEPVGEPHFITQAKESSWWSSTDGPR